MQKNSETVFTPELKGYKSITSRKQLVEDLKIFKSAQKHNYRYFYGTGTVLDDCVFQIICF